MENNDDSTDAGALPPPLPDHRRILTPARELTLGRLYEIYQGDVDKIAATARRILYFEDVIATGDYRWAADLDSRTPEDLKEYQEDVKKLTNLYVETKLASGSHQAEQMIRNIEVQARSQAPDTPTP